MAQFYGGIQGQRGEATRLGSKSSGMNAFVQGWNCGVKVVAYHDDDAGDTFRIYLTSGSNGRQSDTLLGTMSEKGGFDSEF
jgi:hypothetical protein